MKSVNKKNEPVKTTIQYQQRKGINSLEIKGATELVDLSIDKYGHVIMSLNRDSTKENILDTETPDFVKFNRKNGKTYINISGIEGQSVDIESLNDSLLMVDENNGTFYLMPKSDDTKENLLSSGNEIVEIDRILEELDENGNVVNPAETKIFVRETEITTESTAIKINEIEKNKFELIYLGDSSKEYLLRNLTPERLRIDRTDEGTFITILSDKNKENTLVNGNEELLEIDKQESNETKLTVLPDKSKENLLETDTPETVSILRENGKTKINVEAGSGNIREWNYYCVGDKTDKDNINAILSQYATNYGNTEMWCKINIIGKMGFNTNSSGNIRVYQKNVILNFEDCDCSVNDYSPLFIVQAYSANKNLIIENLNLDYTNFDTTAITSGSKNLTVRNCNLINCRFNITRSDVGDSCQKFTIIDSNCTLFSNVDTNKQVMVMSQVQDNRTYTAIEYNFINSIFQGYNVEFFELYSILGGAVVNVDKCIFINSQYQNRGSFTIFNSRTADTYMQYCTLNFRNSIVKNCAFLSNWIVKSSVLNIQNNYLEVINMSPNHNGSSKLIFVGNFILPGSELIGLEPRINTNYYIPENSNHYL